MYKRVRGWIGCAVSPGKKRWLSAPPRGPGQLRVLRRWEICFIDWSWDHEKRVGKRCIQITLSNFTSIHMIYNDTKSATGRTAKNSARICSISSVTAPSLTNVSLFNRYLPKWWGMGFFMICIVLFLIRETFFVHAIQKFVTRRKYIFSISAFAKGEGLNEGIIKTTRANTMSNN